MSVQSTAVLDTIFKKALMFSSSLQSCITHNEHNAYCTLKVYKLN